MRFPGIKYEEVQPIHAEEDVGRVKCKVFSV